MFQARDGFGRGRRLYRLDPTRIGFGSPDSLMSYLLVLMFGLIVGGSVVYLWERLTDSL